MESTAYTFETRRRKRGRGRPPKYPFRGLKHGWGFLVPATPKTKSNVAGTLQGCAQNAAKRLGTKYTLTTVDWGVLVTRVQ